jgi:hypothetical protein
MPPFLCQILHDDQTLSSRLSRNLEPEGGCQAFLMIIYVASPQFISAAAHLTQLRVRLGSLSRTPAVYTARLHISCLVLFVITCPLLFSSVFCSSMPQKTVDIFHRPLLCHFCPFV